MRDPVTIQQEMAEILSRYEPGMALYTFNGDSDRYWKLKKELERATTPPKNGALKTTLRIFRHIFGTRRCEN